MPIRIVALRERAAILGLALKHRLTAYDASYLALARTEGSRLATFDIALRRAATAERVDVLPAELAV